VFIPCKPFPAKPTILRVQLATLLVNKFYSCIYRPNTPAYFARDEEKSYITLIDKLKCLYQARFPSITESTAGHSTWQPILFLYSQEKHSSLFGQRVIDEEKSYITLPPGRPPE
jgi:hypothetical protein